jgi:hypothetical protein
MRENSKKLEAEAGTTQGGDGFADEPCGHGRHSIGHSHTENIEIKPERLLCLFKKKRGEKMLRGRKKRYPQYRHHRHTTPAPTYWRANYEGNP